MNQSHYFTATAIANESELQQIRVTLCDQERILYSAEGVFSAQRLDKATQILLKKAPVPPTEGNFLDLGCGWGPIALSLGIHSPKAQVFATDISPRALDLTKQNAQICQLRNLQIGLPEQIVTAVKAAGGLDLIWSNPPVRVGKKELHAIMNLWLPLLKDDGYAVMVMGKNLGADSFASWLGEQGYQVDRLGSKQGFRLLEVRK